LVTESIEQNTIDSSIDSSIEATTGCCFDLSEYFNSNQAARRSASSKHTQ